MGVCCCGLRLSSRSRGAFSRPFPGFCDSRSVVDPVGAFFIKPNDERISAALIQSMERTRSSNLISEPVMSVWLSTAIHPSILFLCEMRGCTRDWESPVIDWIRHIKTISPESNISRMGIVVLLSTNFICITQRISSSTTPENGD